MDNRLTIKDIARLSGVGKSTVSRVLNNESGVRPETRNRVKAVMHQHNFLPSRSARAMRGQSDHVVALIVTRLDSLSENRAVQTMLPFFYQQGYDPIIMESQFSSRKVEEHLQVLRRRHIDGVILFSFTGLDESILQSWQNQLVMIARNAEGLSSVCYDDEGAIHLLMQTLYKRGHRHISFMGVPHHDTTTGLLRHKAYTDCCQQYGLQAIACLPGLSMHLGYEQVPKVLTEKTTALVCATDSLALGASKYLQEHRRTDIQLASIGSTPLVTFLHPEIVTVDLGYGEAGLRAAEQLVSQINGLGERTKIMIPSKLN